MEVEPSTCMLMEAITGHTGRNNTRRARHYLPVLYAFPSYDKCDSLLYFPNALSRCVNTADFKELSKLFGTHLERNCDITVVERKPQPNWLVGLFRFMNEIYPDLVLCVSNTTVVENRIYATVHAKYTECQAIINSVRRQAPRLQPMEQLFLGAISDENLKERLKKQPIPESEKERIGKLMDERTDVVIYLKVNVTIAFDNLTRKITELHFGEQLTTVQRSAFNCSPPMGRD